MMRILILLFLFTLTTAGITHAQIDTLQIVSDTLHTDTLQLLDETALQNIHAVVVHQSPLLNKELPHSYDIQQMHNNHDSGVVFFFLLFLLFIIAYLKTAFSNEVDELFQSMWNSNMANQIFRSMVDEWTISSVLLLSNFMIVAALFTRYAVISFTHTTHLDSLYSIAFLIFLFTFFYAAKVLFMNLLGWTFEMSDITSQYNFHLASTCKTLGLALLPTLFVFYASGEKYSTYIIIIALLIIAVFLLLLITRWLSTSIKLLYKSVYHFFLYVCVGEIATLFLFLKLFTKTIN